MKILIIEDNEQLQRVFMRFVKMFFQTTDIAVVDNARDGIFLLETHDYALVISDFDLKDSTNGGQVLAWLKEHKPAAVDRFAFVSANAAASQLHDRCLPKPCTIDEMRAFFHAFL